MLYNVNMTKVQYSSEVLVSRGKIRRCVAIGGERASDEEVAVIDQVKPMMTFWLRSRILAAPELSNATILVKSKISETASGLTVDLKIQGVTIARNSEVTE